MKQIFILSFAFAAFLFTSCDSDDDNASFNDQLIGTWNEVHSEDVVYPDTLVTYVFNNDKKTGEIIVRSYTDKDNYTDWYKLKMTDVYFKTEQSIAITSEVVHIDEKTKKATIMSSEYNIENIRDILFLSSDSLSLLGGGDMNKNAHSFRKQ